MMYSDVVMEKAMGIEPKGGKGIRKVLDERLEEMKKKRGVESDADLSADDLKTLAGEFKKIVKDVLGKPFPEDPLEQIWGGIGAVFASWNGKRAVDYRRIERIPAEWGTAVNVQAMVFGNMGDSSATGVAFSRNPGIGENKFYGEYLVNAQGEDVVAGTRTPAPINEASKNDQSRDLPSLEKLMPKLYKELAGYRARLEKHYKDMQDIEFTIEDGTLYMLQCRVGKRNGISAVRMATEMLKEGLINEETALMRVAPNQLFELLLPMLDPKVEKSSPVIAKGLPAGPGGAKGRVVFTSEDAVKWAAKGNKVILVREETSPEDVDGMHKSEAILTSKGGMTSHAALVAQVLQNQEGRHDQGRRLDQPERQHGSRVRGSVAAGGRGPRQQQVLQGPDEDRRQGSPLENPYQRRHAEGCRRGREVWRGGHRPVPHRAHVLR